MKRFVESGPLHSTRPVWVWVAFEAWKARRGPVNAFFYYCLWFFNIIALRFPFFTFSALLYHLPFCFTSLCSSFIYHLSSPELGSIILVCISENLLYSTTSLIELAVQIGWSLACFWYHRAGDQECHSHAMTRPVRGYCLTSICPDGIKISVLLDTRVFLCFVWEQSVHAAASERKELKVWNGGC